MKGTKNSMQITKSGFYGLFFLVLLSGQLIRPHSGSSTLQILIDTAVPFFVGFLLLIPLCLKRYDSSNGFRTALWCFVFCLGLATTVMESLDFYNTVSNERIGILFFAIVMFGVAVYAGMLDCSSVKTAGMFVSFLLMFVIVTVVLFNLPNTKISNIDISTDIDLFDTLKNSLMLVPLVPAFVVFNRQNELKLSRIVVLMLLVIGVLVVCNIVVEAILKSDQPFFTIPIHTLAVVAEFSIFRRLDVVLRIILFLSGIMTMCVFGSALSFMLKRRVFYFVMAGGFIATLFFYNISDEGTAFTVGLVSLVAVVLTIFTGKRALKSAVVALFAFGLLGCSGQELRERAAVTMTFVDWNGQYEVSLLVCTEYGKDEPVTSLVEGRGESISQALFEASKSVNGEIYMGINETIILGKGLSELDFSSVLIQLYEVRLSSGKSYLFLSEHTGEEFFENEQGLMDIGETLLKQSSDKRTVSKRVYDITTTENGSVEGVYPIIELFDSSGVMANSAALYKDGTRIATLDAELMETYTALTGDRERLAVEYDYEGAGFVSELSTIGVDFRKSGNTVVVSFTATGEGTLNDDQKEAVKQSMSERIIDLINFSIENDIDILGFEKQLSLNIDNIEKIAVSIDIEDRKKWV